MSFLRLFFVSILAVSSTACGGAGAGSPGPGASGYAPAPLGTDVARRRVPLDYAPARGPRDAAVTVVVFSDFECPFCRRIIPTLARLGEEHAGRLRTVFRHFPLPMHAHARLAAAVSSEAYAQGGAELFWRVHDRLFALEEFDVERVLHLAEQLGVDRPALEAALVSGRHEAAIDTDVALAASLGVTGTPSLFINGRLIEGALPYEDFDAVVRQELERADRALATGVAPADLYTALTWSERRGPAGRGAPPTRPEVAPSGHRPESPIYRVPLTGDEPQRGPRDAAVTVVAFSDYQCPFCGRVEPTLDQLLEQASDVRLVWMNNPLPFHEHAPGAAEAALEIHRQQGDTGFWRFHALLFANQGELDRATLERLAMQAGADMDAFGAALDDHRHRATIDRQKRLANGLGARGTPSFFINGRLLTGAQPLGAFQEVVGRARADASALLADGVPPGDVYARIVADGRTSALPRPGREAAPSGPDPDAVHELPIPASAPRRGPRDAPIVIQEITDLQCPFCARAQPALEQIVRDYPDQVQIVWRDYPLPFHQHAGLAAEAAREVKAQRGDAAFFEYTAILFANQRDLGLEKLVEYAGQIPRVDARRLRRALTRRTHQAVVEADVESAQVLGSIGTPTFLIDGRSLVGAQPYERFREAVEAAIERRGATP